jgi:hypothetical protein
MYPQSLEWVIRQPNFSGTIPAQRILVVQEFLAKQSKKRRESQKLRLNCGWTSDSPIEAPRLSRLVHEFSRTTGMDSGLFRIKNSHFRDFRGQHKGNKIATHRADLLLRLYNLSQ